MGEAMRMYIKLSDSEAEQARRFSQNKGFHTSELLIMSS